MLERMTSVELAELMVICRHELVGYDRSDFHAARMAQTMTGGKLTDHFPPRMTTEDEQQSFDDLLSALSNLIPVAKHGNPQQIVDPD